MISGYGGEWSGVHRDTLAQQKRKKDSLENEILEYACPKTTNYVEQSRLFCVHLGGIFLPGSILKLVKEIAETETETEKQFQIPVFLSEP